MRVVRHNCFNRKMYTNVIKSIIFLEATFLQNKKVSDFGRSAFAHAKSVPRLLSRGRRTCRGHVGRSPAAGKWGNYCCAQCVCASVSTNLGCSPANYRTLVRYILVPMGSRIHTLTHIARTYYHHLSEVTFTKQRQCHNK